MTASQLIDPADSLEDQNARLIAISEALMAKIEQSSDPSGLAYAQFERAAILEGEVRQRTVDLERALELLHKTNERLGAANRAAEAARANLAEAVESINEGFALFDEDDRLVMSNSRFCRDLADVVPDIEPGLSFHHYVELISQSIYLALPDGVTKGEWRDRRMQRHKDDRVIFNVRLTRDRWLQVGEHRTATGGTVILQTDVSDIIRAEREKRDRLMDRQAQMVRATLDHLNQGVCIFDNDLRLVGWNTGMEALLDRPIHGQLVGITFDALIARLNDEITFSEHFTRDHLLAWAHRRRARRPITFEVTRRPAQILSVFAQEMPDRGFVISFTDVTTEREAARALREMNETLEARVADRTEKLGHALDEARRANASKTRFVAAASHDLLQPLSAAKLFVSFLSDRATDDLSRATADKAVSALASVEHIIEALLDISKLDSGQAIMNVQDVPLNEILSSLRTELTPMAEAEGLSLHIRDTDHIVRSDPVFLRRILQNLVTNAIRYTDTGRVVVGVRRRGDAARVEVWDTGPGIAPEDQKTIFQEFKQLGPYMSGSKGLGLGLAIVDLACASLGHDLTLRSEPGRGSCFAVTVTRSSLAQRGPTPRRSEGREARPRAEGLVVLLVENDEELASALSLTIEEWGSHVVHAQTAEQALALLDEIDIAPDRLLLDHQLGPGMTGLELYKQLRAQFGALPARIITANRDRALAEKCRRAGVDLVPKPLEAASLIALIDDEGPAADR
ncbi:His Kinase A (phospho-acceptor) domain-containing protein [Palleronia salina]|uniref:histidine kinase n=1 Tax=Palleronia salina TaxID=313368 RepID=A0A1M6HWJ9_9RHOB|nr:PAS-domain containing protein [Palleronia salina]SHJ26591.1 His Kinase A (phospho-acceptor) domain-containing protein [Palleronia salina]